MKLLACIYIWWPNLGQNIEDLVKSCRECATQRHWPPIALLHSWDWANQLVKRLHIDFEEIEGWQVLVIIDVHSKWTKAATTASTLQTFSANFGLPRKLVLDNGSQFTTQTFSNFCKVNGIKHYLPHLITLLQMGQQNTQCRS